MSTRTDRSPTSGAPTRCLVVATRLVVKCRSEGPHALTPSAHALPPGAGAGAEFGAHASLARLHRDHPPVRIWGLFFDRRCDHATARAAQHRLVEQIRARYPAR